MIPETDIGWLAGILDFQGHIIKKDNQQRARGSVQVVLYVETRIEPIITRLSRMTGTAVEPHPQAKLKEEWTRKGCQEHCPEAHVHVPPTILAMPDMYRWTVSGAALAVVLWNVRDYMCTTDEPWNWAIATALASTKLTGQGSGAALGAVRRLAGLGWELPPVMREAIREPVKAAAGEPAPA
jgi:hypothetical protein